MSYVTQFTDASSIEALTGETIDENSDPSYSQVLEWIEEVEKEMVAKGYSTESLTGVIMDIEEGSVQQINDILESAMYSTKYYSTGRVIPLPHTPFISVSNVQRNLNGYEEDPDWEDLTEGPASGSSFLVINKQYKAGLRGTALYFYTNAPSIGYHRMKLDYTWGYNLPETVLREYATSKTGLMVLYAKYMRKEPIFDITLAGLKTSLNPFTDVHIFMIDRIKQITKEWLPSEFTGIALLP